MQAFDASIKGCRIQQVVRQDGVLSIDHGGDQVISNGIEPFIASTPAEEHAGVANGCQSRP